MEQTQVCHHDLCKVPCWYRVGGQDGRRPTGTRGVLSAQKDMWPMGRACLSHMAFFLWMQGRLELVAEGPAQERKGRQSGDVHFLTLRLSCFLLPGFPLPAPVTPGGFLWWQSSSLCEANDLPLCEAYWRLDLDTDSADGLSAPLLGSPETGAGPLQSAAPAHSHGSGSGPTEHT